MERELSNVPDSICKIVFGDGGCDESPGGHCACTCEMRVAVVLYRLGSCGEYRVIANQFGVHKCTVKKFVYMFCKGMLSYTKNLIQVPSLEKANAIAHRFEMEHHIPQIIRGVDETHIPIVLPKDGYRDFANCKGWPSYVLQAVVDDRYW